MLGRITDGRTDLVFDHVALGNPATATGANNARNICFGLRTSISTRGSVAVPARQRNAVCLRVYSVSALVADAGCPFARHRLAPQLSCFAMTSRPLRLTAQRCPRSN